tara:strand:+ start:98 stop:310 length:213 start_codon:yes stop_codon:yes gene_type:complete
MLTTVEQRAEARRLVDLNARGRLVESVALALRIGEDQEAAMSELVRMDRDMVEWISAGLGEGDLRSESEG